MDSHQHRRMSQHSSQTPKNAPRDAPRKLNQFTSLEFNHLVLLAVAETHPLNIPLGTVAHHQIR